MIPVFRFNIQNTDAKSALQYSVRFDLIEAIHPQGGNNKGSVVHIGGVRYLSTDKADELQARWEGFYATKQREEKEPSKPIQECGFESDINYCAYPDFTEWWNKKRRNFKADSLHMKNMGEMSLYVASEAWLTAKGTKK
jgi:hypothetical protein